MPNALCLAKKVELADHHRPDDAVLAAAAAEIGRRAQVGSMDLVVLSVGGGQQAEHALQVIETGHASFAPRQFYTNVRSSDTNREQRTKNGTLAICSLFFVRTLLSFVPPAVRLPEAKLGGVLLLRRLEHGTRCAQVGFDACVVQVDTKVWLVRHYHITTCHIVVRQAGDQILPEKQVETVMLQRDKTRDGGGAMNIGHKGDRRAGKMQRGRQPVALGIVGDPLRLNHTTRCQQVGVDDINRALLDQLAEAIPQIELLAGGGWNIDRVGHLLMTVDVPPGHRIFQPRQAKRLHGLAEPNDFVGRHIAVAKVIGAERNLPTDGLTRGGDDLDRAGDALVGNLRALAGARRPPALTQDILELSRLAADAALTVFKQPRPDVELDKGQPERFALAHRRGVTFSRRFLGRGRVGVEAHPVAVFAAQELVARHAIDLAHEIPQGNLDARDAAALAPPVAKLLDRAKDHVYIARILAKQNALELQRILLVAGVAHLAEAIDALIGVDANDWVVVVAGDHRDAHVGNFEVRRAGIGVDRVFDATDAFLFFRHMRHLCDSILA